MVNLIKLYKFPTGVEQKKKKNNKKRQSTQNKHSMGPVSESNGLNEEERGAVVASLHRVLKPFLLRRIKTDVIADLPGKVQQIIKSIH